MSELNVGEALYADESSKVTKARLRLLKNWEVLDAQITPAALTATVQKIHNWIADYAVHRVPLKKKEIHLFDHNRNVANLSRKIQQIADGLKAATSRS